MSDDPFAKYVEPPAAGAADPFAKYAPEAVASDSPKAAYPAAATAEQPGLLERADDILSNHPVYNVAKTALPPIANFLVADPIRGLAADVVGGVRSPPFTEAGREGFWQARDKSLEQSAGLRMPETETGQAITSAAGTIGGTLAKALGGASNLVLGEGPTAAIAPFAQIGGDLLPAIGARVGAARGAAGRPAEMAPTPQAAAARAAGYKLPPEEISAKPSMVSRLLAGEGGRWKRQQAFSTANQETTNSLAARSVGLPPETRLNEAAYNEAKKPAISVYDSIKSEVPEVILGEPEFRAAVDNIGAKTAETERDFPTIASNPSVAALKKELLARPVVATKSAFDQIAKYRTDARANFRSQVAHDRELGWAQLEAAKALEDAVERSIAWGKAPADAFKAAHAAEQKLLKEQAANVERGYSSGREVQAQAELYKATKDVQAALAAVDPADVAKAQALRTNFQKARQLFAKIYDLESVTNMATGEVNAQRLAALRQKGKRRFDGELKQIADTSDAFRKQTQMPSKFGHEEDFSIFDLYAGLGAAAAGHPVAGAVAAGRLPARRLLRSDSMQNRMFNRQPFMSSPLAGAAAGEGIMPRDDDPLNRAIGY